MSKTKAEQDEHPEAGILYRVNGGDPVAAVDMNWGNEQAAADARVLTEIRAYYTLLAVDGHGASVTLTMRELGILLRIADEYQALKRSLVEGDES